ncbi:MAG: PTS lactose/cellobiose transporter subunit IIA [Anaerovibrio sp.]
MEENDELEIQVFQIISAVGTARSCYIEAIHAARERDYERAAQLLAKGDENFAEGHDVHLELLGREAEGTAVACLLVMHAEDQLMSAEAFKLVAQELIDVYREMDKL